MNRSRSYDGLDPAKLETYLADGDFVGHFKTPKEAFAALPAWKRKSAKQKLGLF